MRLLTGPMRHMAIGFAAIGVLVVFQNCGSSSTAGEGDSASTLLAETSETKKYKAAPFPWDVNVNQVAFMTCPMTAATEVAPTEDLDAPFFTTRVGAYDNRVLANRYPQLFPGVTGLTEQERAARLKAGLGLRAEFVDYIRREFAARLAAKPDPKSELKILLRNALQESPHDLRLAKAFVFRQRSLNGFSFDGKFVDVKPIFNGLKDPGMLERVLSFDMPATGAPERLNYLEYPEDIAFRSFVASLSLTTSEQQRERLRTAAGFDSQITVGFTPNEEDAQVFELASPDNDNNKSLYGRSYRLNLSATWPGRIDYAGTTPTQTIRKDTDFISATNGVTEIVTQGLEGTRRTEADNSTLEQQQWDCFSLMIVREVDRRNRDGVFLDPDRDLSLWTRDAAGNLIRKNKYYDYQPAANAAIVPAAKVACPPQDVGNTSTPGSLNFASDGGLARLRLEVARRMLPAEYWDINTNPEYMCAVPRETVQGFGQCYKSGDFNGGQYILYAPGVVQELGRNVECGINTFTGEVQKECPAYVSICYRKR